MSINMHETLDQRVPAVGERLRVLLIEDSNNDALLLERALKLGGFDPVITRVQTDSEMRGALRDQEQYDIILSDWHLPTFSGLRAFDLVRELHVDLPFIILSGVVGEESAVEAMLAGVHDYVMKDKIMRLVPAIQRELREAQVRRERRQARRELQETQERFTLFMRHVPGLAFIKNSDGEYIFVNEAFRDVAAGDESPLGRTDYAITSKSEADKIAAADRHVIATGEPVDTVDAIVVDGQPRSFLTVRFPLPQQDGKVLLGGLSIDITERKRAEDQLRALTEELQHRTQELEKKNVALSEVLGNIENEKANMKQQIAENIEQRVMPTLRLLAENAPESMRGVVHVLKQELNDVAAPFVQTLQAKAGRLTSRELEVCRMIKHGMSTKEIADTLSLSPATVQKHREVIRRKLGLSGSEINLHTFLQTL